MIPKKLISQLNSGRCFALVGSGPSTAMGYPSWGKLAQAAVALLPDSTTSETAELASTLANQSRFPELFDVVADAIGGMGVLANRLKQSLKRQHEKGWAYEVLAKWPIRCYLTTNYDDEIARHLKRIKISYVPLNNSQTDFAQIEAHTNERIVKLHGDFDYSDGLVLGLRQYQEFKTQGKRQYFRDKLKSIFSMVPVIVVGHSLSDPDLSLVLETACELNSFDRPIYMILADVRPADSRKYREQYNVELLSYENPDGTHRELKRLLRLIDRFVIPREQCAQIPLDFPDPDEARVATSLYLFSKFGLGSKKGKLFQRAISPQILAATASEADKIFTDDELTAKLLPLEIRQHPEIETFVSSSTCELQDANCLRDMRKGVQITETGRAKYDEVTRSRDILESQVVGLLRETLRSVDDSTVQEVDSLVRSFQQTLLSVFRKRGLAASSMLFRHKPLEAPDMPEIFETIMRTATSVTNFDLRLAYSDFVMDLLTRPTQTQREYLVNVAQGFFAFHIFGADPSGAEARRFLAQETAWICDSNILLPLVAEACHLHGFATELFGRMRALGITPLTTGAFITETFESYKWAFRQCVTRNPTGSHDVILQLIRDPNYSDNLFVDGYINGAGKGQWNTFDEYAKRLGIGSHESLEAKLETFGVVCRNLHQYDGYTATTYAENEQLVNEIIVERTAQGTLRAGESQASAEAEVIQIIRGIRQGILTPSGSTFQRAFFVSTSRLLDILYGATDGLITWYPENLYRHLHILTSDALDADRAFDAMTSNYYSIGVEVIDEQAYRQFFSPVISESRVILEQEREKFQAAVEADVRGQQKASDELTRKFEATPDLDKPRFAAQAGWFVARRQEKLRQVAEARANRAEEARVETERRSKLELKEMQAEYDRKAEERRQHEDGRMKNIQDPKHLRKRARQAKKRRKNKKSGGRGRK